MNILFIKALAWPTGKVNLLRKSTQVSRKLDATTTQKENKNLMSDTYSSSQCLIQVFDDVGFVFQANGEPDQGVADAQHIPLIFWHWCMGHNRPERYDREGLHIGLHMSRKTCWDSNGEHRQRLYNGHKVLQLVWGSLIGLIYWSLLPPCGGLC